MAAGMTAGPPRHNWRMCAPWYVCGWVTVHVGVGWVETQRPKFWYVKDKSISTDFMAHRPSKEGIVLWILSSLRLRNSWCGSTILFVVRRLSGGNEGEKPLYYTTNAITCVLHWLNYNTITFSHKMNIFFYQLSQVERWSFGTNHAHQDLVPETTIDTYMVFWHHNASCQKTVFLVVYVY